ncbi:transcriptional regulator LacI family [Thermoclostridium stercorarium subsp. stercorarium DSM 8532]|jgi:LacI family transcriptional regulator|uniref:Transcriptional regulator LacI family n=3 Tax=Thermoclostridium stercorarium TaxID=1510 RepID=L7VKS4_THES1|nr:LacI family DNA-binding transcriptional regulator [Thermoclostridium stercorarium]AGC67264.1 transcriptional regulator LacI family [Thermoclostridium stercorarium subsp. stercorarium DSM 8532]AGI38333.1 transcriptional regulator [Thermoclostridium stercorarium subsp. stercorarium DSM 8532]ANW97769.1 LacI family transcriptional regulator [Thermoclostridium stercorarium subsp. thermolacticum DSM 2910]ANX00296.1 LacI family transcriptional regulator [Thermoclostridium stercorarium subsp. leptos
MKKTKVSIRDIARECNVSVATVSRVINNSGAVREETRKLVQSVIEKYNYRPNELARGLYTQRTKSIGVILPEITNHFFAKVFLEIEKAAIEYGQTVFLCNTMSDNALQDFYTMRLSEKQVDGLILLGGRVNETVTNVQYVKLLKNVIYPTPVVIINGKLDNYYDNCASVSSDEYEAMFQAVDYLTGLGHKKIGFLGGIRGIMSTDIKLNALEKAKDLYDFTMKDEWIKLSSYTYQGGVEAMLKLLKEKELPTAIISINDEVAAGVINTCISEGYKVPEDFSVLGFDNSSISMITMPKLTTLSHPYMELGSMAVDFLNNMINDKPMKGITNISLKMDLVERESCSVPRKW